MSLEYNYSNNMNPTDIILQSITACLEDWDYFSRYPWSTDNLNAFIVKHESTLVTSGGLFLQGLRATSSTESSIPRRQRIDGLLGIVDMNIFVMRQRYSQMLSQMQRIIQKDNQMHNLIIQKNN